MTQETAKAAGIDYQWLACLVSQEARTQRFAFSCFGSAFRRRRKGVTTIKLMSAGIKNAASLVAPKRPIASIIPTTIPTPRPNNTAPITRELFFFAVKTAESPIEGVATSTNNMNMDCMCLMLPNDRSSATAAMRRADCNDDGLPPFAAALG